jgi:hypothetical protein
MQGQCHAVAAFVICASDRCHQDSGRDLLRGRQLVEQLMTQKKLNKTTAAVPTLACATLLSVGWPEQHGVSLSTESAHRSGRPPADSRERCGCRATTTVRYTSANNSGCAT